MTPADFCAKHDACDEGRAWAISTGCATMRDLWQRDDLRPDWRIWIAARPGVMTDRDLRLFACWCVRQVWHLLADERSRNAVEVAERFARGEATDQERAAAWAAARDAARAAWAAAMDAAWDAARGAAWAAAMDSAMDVAWAASRYAARAASGAASDASRDAQAEQLKTYEVHLD